MTERALGSPQTGLRQAFPAVVAGFLVVLVSFSGPFLVVQLAAKNASLSANATDGWIFAAAFASGVAAIVLSLWLRQPIICAFSSGGAVLLVSSLQDYTFTDAIGAYLLVAIGLIVIGLTHSFSMLMARLPKGIVSAMLAGVLFNFGTGYFSALPGSPPRWKVTVLVVLMGAAFFIGRVRGSRLAIVWTALTGVLATLGLGLTTSSSPRLHVVHLTAITPTFHFGALTGLGLPLLALALSSQYAPGYAVLRESGYTPNMDRVLVVTGGLSAVFAPFGGPGVHLAAITAGIATGEDAHVDPAKRFIAALSAGVFYMLAALFGGSLLSIFSVLPKEFVVAITGLALFGAISGSLASALADAHGRDGVVVALLCAASGFSLFHIGAPFWALVLGLAVDGLEKRFARRS
jgi:benzoate membrane transport protein